MTTNFAMESFCNQDKKNIKNIYVQKINSLMKLSKDTLLRQDLQSSNNNQKKKLKKTISEVDKNTLKLQKNRESAKKARLRKKIYIKMLQSQIDSFKRLKAQGDELNEESETFLANKKSLKKDIQMNELIQHDANVDKFLSGSDLGQVLKIQNKQFQKKLKQRDTIIEQIYQLSTSSLIKKLKGSKNLQVFQPILKKQARQNMENFQNLIKRISYHYDVIKNTFRKIQELTQVSKKLSRYCRTHHIDHCDINKYTSDLISVQRFMETLDLNRQSQYTQENKNKQMLSQSDNFPSSKSLQNSLVLFNDINLHTTEKLLIRSQKFFQHTLFDQQQ